MNTARLIMTLSLFTFFAASAGDGLTFVEAIKDGDGGVAIKNHVGAISIHNGFVYVGIVYTGQIKIFKQDPATGKLTYTDDCVWAGEHDVVGTMLWIGDRLYFYGGAGHWTGDGDSRGLNWFDVEKDGKLSNKSTLKIPLAAGLAAGSDGKSLYVLLGQQRKIARYTLSSEGKPEKADEIVLKAGGPVSTLTLTADGKALYCLGEENQVRFLYCARVSESGTLSDGGKFSLKEMNEGIDWPKGKWGYGWGNSYNLSPDGLHVYADFCNYGSADFRVIHYTRNPSTNEIAFKENLSEKASRNMTRINMAFESDGSAGYFISGSECAGNCVGWFKRDAQSGQIEFGGAIKETKGSGPCSICLDSEHGFLYAGGWARQQLFVMRTGRK
jgi:hypothetical protein